MRSSTKKNILIATAAIAAFVVSAPVYAISGAPLQFDDYVVGDVGGATTGNVAGEITANCNVGDNFTGATVVCGEATLSDGMMQRQVTVTGAGSLSGTYVQFIMVESGSQGDASAAAFSTDRGISPTKISSG